MENSVKCTYDDCSKCFPSIQAMKRHKAKDNDHDYYCKRCDYDGTDDTWLFYHQITSLKHICCPVCGQEFKSEGGRDRHVDIEHLPKQKMNCAGCDMHFTSASGLMAHIEEDQCPVIKRMHFYRQRAERQITKDAWQNAQDPSAGTTLLSDIDASQAMRTEPTLLDDDRAWIEVDWAGNPIEDQENDVNGSNSSTATKQTSAISADTYPALDPRSRQQRRAARQDDVKKDLLDFEPLLTSGVRLDHEDQIPNSLKSDLNTLSIDDNQSSVKNGPLCSNNSDISGSMVTARSTATFRTAPASRGESLMLPHDQPYNDSNAHITTATQVMLPSHLEMEKYWDPLAEQYACPGRKCGQRFSSIDSFKAHLISDTHVDSKVTCPNCLKRFKTTAALIAHCESASRKCKIRHALDYDMVIRQITAGMISADGYQEDGSIRYTAQKIEDW